MLHYRTNNCQFIVHNGHHTNVIFILFCGAPYELDTLKFDV